jgi:hypothetical protein
VLTKHLKNGIRIQPVAGFILALAAMPFLSSSAKACGDEHGPPASASMSSDLATSLQPRKQLPLPCNGPNCSRVPDRAPLAPVTAPTAPVDQSVCLNCVFYMPQLPISRTEFGNISFWPAALPCGLERPPRA